VSHIVDTLIQERAEKLRQRPRLWSLVQKYLYPLLGYEEAVALVDEVQGQSGIEVFDHLSDMLQMDVDVRGLEHLPRSGRVVLMPNHPAGIADGIAVYEAVKSVRPDVTFFANRDAVRCQPRLSEIIIPVEWMETRRNHSKTKETVRNVIQAFRDERLIVIFASGRLARPTPFGLIEREWLSSGVSLAQKYHCPIVPLHIEGHNSALYYLFWFLNSELRDMTLFRELLNKSGQRYRLQLGEPIRSELDEHELTPMIRRFVVNDLRRGRTRFTPRPQTRAARH